MAEVYNEGTENVFYIGFVDNDLQIFDLPHRAPICFMPRHVLAA